MNKVWTIISIVSIAALIYLRPESVLKSMNEAAYNTVTLMLKLAALYTVWMGVLQIAEKAGLTQKLAKLLRPLIRLLFGNVPEDTAKHISINMAANIIGVGTASTPAGIAAIKSMDKGSETATDNMIMLLAINATGMQLIPTTIISLRQAFGSASPSDILIPTIIATFASTIFAVIAVKLLAGLTRKKRAAARQAALPPRSAADKAG
jgi:spore maturation protein A